MTRLPLQVGSTSSWSLLRTSLGLVPGGVALFVGAQLERGAVIAFALGAFLVLYAVQNLVRAWRARPSDALLDERGVRFDGGRADGLFLEWGAIDPATAVEDVKELRLSLTKLLENAVFLVASTLLSSSPELAPEQRLPLRRLRLKAKDGRQWLLAEAETESERESLDALVGSLQAKLGVAPAAAAELAPGVLACSACGAALVPAATATAKCAFCGKSTAVPAELQARVAAQQELAASRAGAEQRVRALLEQPSASRAWLGILAAGAGASSGWLAAVAPLVLIGLRDVDAFNVGVALVSGVLVSVAVTLLAQRGLADRHGLRLLATSFGARAGKGEAPSCRRCRAPLPAADRTVVGCAYCGAENVLGVDLRGEVAPARAQRLSLEQLFAQREGRRQRALVGALVAFALGGVAVSFLVVSGAVAGELDAKRRACEGGDAEACTRAGLTYSTGSTVGVDKVKSAAFFERGCALGNGEACWYLSRAFHWGEGVETDAAREVELQKKACALGWAEACAP